MLFLPTAWSAAPANEPYAKELFCDVALLFKGYLAYVVAMVFLLIGLTMFILKKNTVGALLPLFVSMIIAIYPEAFFSFLNFVSKATIAIQGGTADNFKESC